MTSGKGFIAGDTLRQRRLTPRMGVWVSGLAKRGELPFTAFRREQKKM